MGEGVAQHKGLGEPRKRENPRPQGLLSERPVMPTDKIATMYAMQANSTSVDSTQVLLTQRGEYLVMSAALSDFNDNIGVLLLDPSSDRLHLRFRRDFDEEESDWLSVLAHDLHAKSL